ncbi:hypothetical protein CVT24_002473, partial [Panaeolus cyanescens]
MLSNAVTSRAIDEDVEMGNAADDPAGRSNSQYVQDLIYSVVGHPKRAAEPTTSTSTMPTTQKPLYRTIRPPGPLPISQVAHPLASPSQTTLPIPASHQEAPITYPPRPAPTAQPPRPAP